MVKYTNLSLHTLDVVVSTEGVVTIVSLTENTPTTAESDDVYLLHRILKDQCLQSYMLFFSRSMSMKVQKEPCRMSDDTIMNIPN